MKRYWPAVLAFSAVCVLLLAAAAAAGWPGEPNPCIASAECYCELFRPGPMRQPANTLSAFAFIAVGVLLAKRARTRRAAAFCATIALIGPGTMALHASMTKWGGNVDTSSMFLFILFAILLNAARLRPAVERVFWPLYATFAVPLVLLKFWGTVRGEIIFGALVAAFIGLEIAVAALRPRDRTAWFFGGAAGFAAGFAVWLPSRTPTGALCVDPSSLLQGHAAWHLLTALAAGAVFLHLEPELQ
jgi:hypothetical protein